MTFDPATDRRLTLPAHCREAMGAARVCVPVTDLRARPDPECGIDTQLLLGASVTLHDEMEGWALVRAGVDSYVGWCPAVALDAAAPAPTHRVIAPRSFIYLGADMKYPRVECLSLGSGVVIVCEAEKRGTRYLTLADGTAMIADHLAPVASALHDPAAVAEMLIHTPYLWGGASAFGIDCSGLVQLCHAMCGVALLRDTDMQAATAGNEIPRDGLRRGDLVFWKGHVAMMLDEARIIHANGRTMSVAIEGLGDAIARIAGHYGMPTLFRRP